MVADSTKDEKRGSAFGWLHFTGVIGSVFGSSLALLLAPISLMGIDGWRIAFHLVAIISTIVGLLLCFYAVDPHFATKEVEDKSGWDEAKDFVKEVKDIIQIPSFQVLIAQGIPGTFGGVALSFLSMWAELVGFSHGYTAFLMTLRSVGSAIGGIFAGTMGDFLSKYYPNGGRIFLSQISSGSAVPLAAVLLLILPHDPSTRVSHAIAIFLMGFFTSWEDAATNNPIFAEIVPEKSRTSIYALDRSLETILSSFAPPIVGILAENIYGYKIGDTDKNMGDNKTKKENALALSKAMYACIAISMSLCCFLYSFLHCTYPRDRERAQFDSLIASEIVEIELEGNHSHIRDFEMEYNEKTNVFYYEKDSERDVGLEIFSA